ncbi:hypothetical protein [Citricoccus sp. GCM10030269]|uniref:hypothetical protein n=1 Tax=Citricoccus sp. GCM10030269 TaxID=3273388 RepID=UPI00361DD0F6
MKRTPIAALTLATAALVLTGCAQGEPQAAETVTVTATATVTATPSPTPSETAEPEDMDTSARGARVMKAGDSDGLIDADGTELLNFTVNSIEVDPGCTGNGSGVAENGHFVVFDVDFAITEAAAGVLSTPSNMFNTAAYRVIDADGNTMGESPNTNDAHTCLPDEEKLRYDIGPGEKSSGKVVFDVPVESGVLLTESDAAPDLKWEWAF